MSRIGIIGGSGLDDPKILEQQSEKEVSTPYGKPSSPLTFPRTGTPTVTYMTKIPCDVNSVGNPSFFPGDSSGRNYLYSLNGATYQLITCIENSNDTDRNVFSGGVFCVGGGKIYSLTNP